MRVLITGGAQGLGLACVRKALSLGANVVVLDRDEAGLAQLSAGVRCVKADLGRRDEIDAVLDQLACEEPFDFVIMNAGINMTGHFEELPPDGMRQLVEVNLAAPMQLTLGLITAKKLARSGRLVFISSLSHYLGYPGASVYAATKDGVTIFARSLRRTLRKSHGVKVQVVAPGPMDTAHAARHSPTPDKTGGRIAPEVVADVIWRARRRFMIVPGTGAGLAASFGRLFPRLAGRAMRRLIYDKLRLRSPTDEETVAAADAEERRRRPALPQG